MRIHISRPFLRCLPYLAIALLLPSVSCLLGPKKADNPDPAPAPLSRFGHTLEPKDIKIEVSKWYMGKSAALAITYDTPYHHNASIQTSVTEVIRREMRMDMEIISDMYARPEYHSLLPEMRGLLMPLGIRFFGHGHTHINHDALSYQEALKSFRMNFDLMKAWGLNPLVYAYPGCYGHNDSTQLANARAGFIAARGCAVDTGKHVMQREGADLRLEDWYNLPSVIVGKDLSVFKDHASVARTIDKTLAARGFVILMYHAIGIKGGWGYYPQKDFAKDLDYIRDRSIWNGNFQDIVCYIRERNLVSWEIAEDDSSSSLDMILTVDDGLEDSVYTQPLTFRLEIESGLQIEGVRMSWGESETIIPVKDQKMMFHLVPKGQEIKIRFFPKLQEGEE